MESHAETIANIHTTLLQDKTNFSAFGSERRSDILLEYAIGLTYLSELKDEEKHGIAAVAVRQYQQNQQTMVSWLLGGFVCIALFVALIAGNSDSKPQEDNRSSFISAAIPERLIIIGMSNARTTAEAAGTRDHFACRDLLCRSEKQVQ